MSARINHRLHERSAKQSAGEINGNAAPEISLFFSGSAILNCCRRTHAHADGPAGLIYHKPLDSVRQHIGCNHRGAPTASKVSIAATLFLNQRLLLQRDERYVFEQLMRDCAMRTEADLPVNAGTKPNLQLPFRIWMGGLAVRTLFLVVLTVLTARVASPQTENIRSVFETPGDLVRVTLGFAVCAWFVVNIFIPPKDVEAYRTWLYLGIAVLPLSLLCAIVVW
jgi:hypothetical protein